VVAITAEPGGAMAVRERLAERGLPSLDFTVFSDPDHTVLSVFPNVPREIFVTQDHEWDVSGSYRMYQPALVVYDNNVANGQALVRECTWSWRTMLGDATGDDADWNTMVDTQPWAGPIQQVYLVTMRPVMSDLLSAIQERRPVKLASTHEDPDYNKWT
jgi:hypothetical protein